VADLLPARRVQHPEEAIVPARRVGVAHRDRGRARAGRRQLDAERLHAGRPVAVVDHVRVRHRVGRHHGGRTSRLLAAAAAVARDPVRRHGVPGAGGLLLHVEDGARLAGPQRAGGAPARHGT
jgi:hypothetical protein